MTIASEITKLNTNLTNCYTAVNNKGGTLPQAQNFDNLAIAIGSISGGSSPVITSLNVTPTTSAQTITAPSGTDGYSPVNVSAVTSSIDANITAGNIKKDVQILGVTGTYEGSGDVIVLNFGSSAATETITITANNKSISLDVYTIRGNKMFLPVNTAIGFSISGGTLDLYVNNVSVRTGASFTYTFSSNDSVTLQIDAGCCIPYYTVVNYYDGSEKTAEEVRIGDKLLGYNELTKEFQEVEVLDIIYKLRNQIVKIMTENHEIKLTPDHPILTDKGWAVYDLNNSNYKDVDKIKLTDDLKVFVSDGEYENITSIEYIEIETPIDTYTFNVTDEVNSFVAAGVVLHNAPC